MTAPLNHLTCCAKLPEAECALPRPPLQVSIFHELLCEFEPYAEIEADNQKIARLSAISAALKKELENWHAFRTSNLNRFRVGTKVAAVTHEHEVQTVLRFFGFVQSVIQIREPTFAKVFCSQDIGATVERYAQFLESKELAWSSITNYLSGLISASQFATVTMEQPPALDQLANLRRQAEKMAREQNLYRKRSESWIDWPDVQRTRLNVVEAYNSAQPHMKASILKDAVVM